MTHKVRIKVEFVHDGVEPKFSRGYELDMPMDDFDLAEWADTIQSDLVTTVRDEWDWMKTIP